MISMLIRSTYTDLCVETRGLCKGAGELTWLCGKAITPEF
jgi:hypothetical protein